MKQLVLLFSAFLAFELSAQSQRYCHHHVQNERAWPGMETQASNLRSDTIDVLHYDLYLDITDFTGQSISGNTTVTFAPRMNNVTEINLDLLQLVVDSVIMNSTQLSYTYDDTLLKIMLPAMMNVGDTDAVTVWYHGQPQSDASWGGFYFQSGYAYNLGVGFDADPHTYGRVWHPCFDNFVERATYTQTIGSNNGKIAYCNGELIGDTTDGNGVRWRTWNMTDPIPSYLACVAVAAYTHVNWTYNGVNGPVPIMLTAVPADTTGVQLSFVNLPGALSAYESLYYPYMWQRVGYLFVPFNAGAMEHATAISYPRSFATGSLTYQTVMAHELSHHWFGDLATCRTQEDMWLNEGWAVFSEFIFLEWVYGRANYDAAVRDNHDDAVHYFHHQEGWLTMNAIPFTYTYANHVYLKGADLAHTLRGYMGDSLFFPALNYHFSQSEFKDVDSYDFRDNLVASSGLACVNDFFNDWVFNPGWPHFAVDSFVSVPNGPNFDITLYIQQKRVGAPNYYTNVPLEFAFYNNDMTYTSQRIFVSGQYDTLNVTLTYDPYTVVIDPKNLISDAETDEEKMISTTGSHNFAAARCSLSVFNCPDTAWVRVEHHYAAPDPIQNNVNNYNISDLRYWKLTGIWPAGFVARGRFIYDGRTSVTSGGTNWLDEDLTIPNGDSIILLYRANAADDWHEWPYYTKTVTGPAATSKTGYVLADSLLPGEYTFANGVSTVLIGVNEEIVEQDIEVYPSPANHSFNVNIPENITGKVEVIATDVSGRIIYHDIHSEKYFSVETSSWAEGLYFIEVKNGDSILHAEKITVKH